MSEDPIINETVEGKKSEVLYFLLNVATLAVGNISQWADCRRREQEQGTLITT